MNSVGFKIWCLLKENHSTEGIVERLTQHFCGIPEQQIRQDVAYFLASLEELGLVGQARPVTRNSRFERLLLAWQQSRTRRAKKANRSGTRFLTAKAFLGLLAYDLCHLGRNFPLLYRLIQGWATAPHVPPHNIAERVTQAVNYACVLYPKRIFCLQRSVITTSLLRSSGIPAQMVLGVQKSPFKAHAWTEVEGQPINERRNVQRAYLIWERC